MVDVWAEHIERLQGGSRFLFKLAGDNELSMRSGGPVSYSSLDYTPKVR
jgi:hypothetical protein